MRKSKCFDDLMLTYTVTGIMFKKTLVTLYPNPVLHSPLS